MPVTYQRIASTTLSTSASSITFSSIPGTYTDLRLTLVWLGNGGEAYSPDLIFNSNTASNYSFTQLVGNGSSASSGRESNFTRIEAQNSRATTSIPAIYEADIFSYAGSTNKTILLSASSDRNGSGFVERVVGLWRNTSAITSITLTPNVSDFAAGTTATIYGILRA